MLTVNIAINVWIVRGIQKANILTQLITTSQDMYIIFVTFQHSSLQLKCSWSGISPLLGLHCRRIANLALLVSHLPFTDNVSPLKIVPLHGEIWTFIKCMVIHVHIPNGISIGSAMFAGSRLTDQPTDHAAPSVTIGCIYIVVRCSLVISCAIL